MSKILTHNIGVKKLPKNKNVNSSNKMPTTATRLHNLSPVSTSSSTTLTGIEIDDFTTTSSILEFLTKEQECDVTMDADSIFQEVSRLSDNTDARSVDEILREAEILMQKQQTLEKCSRTSVTTIQTKTKAQNSNSMKFKENLNAKFTKSIQHNKMPLKCHSPMQCNGENILKRSPSTQTPENAGVPFIEFVENLPSESVISDESTPKDLHNFTLTTEKDMTSHINDNNLKNKLQTDDTDEGTDTVCTISILAKEIFMILLYILIVLILGVLS